MNTTEKTTLRSDFVLVADDMRNLKMKRNPVKGMTKEKEKEKEK